MRAGAAVLAMTRAVGGHSASTRRSASRAARAERTPTGRVVVVDGDSGARRVLRSRFVREGYEVAVAQSSEQAFELLFSSTTLPLAVVISADLPGTDAFELTAALRRDVQTAGVPVILIGRDDAKERAEAVGADAYLQRPVYLNDVVALVKLEESRGLLDGARHSTTEELPLHLVVRALLTTSRSARLVVKGGQLVFSRGRLVNAVYGDRSGETALRRLLLFHRGEYAVVFGAALTAASLSLDVEALCERVLPTVERWHRVADEKALAERWVVDFRKLASTVHLLPEGMNRILRLCDGRRTVAEVVADSELDEGVTLESLVRLRSTAVLTAVDKDAPIPAPRLRLAPVAPLAEPRLEAPVEEGLAPELQQQLRAFNIRPLRELPEQRPASSLAELSVEAIDFPAEAPAPASVPAAPSTRGGPARALGLGAVLVAVALLGTAVALVMPRSSNVVTAAASVQAPPAAVKDPLLGSISSDVHRRLEDGKRLYAAGHAHEAARVLDGVVKDAPALVDGWGSLAQARLDAKDQRGALRAAQAALELSPDHPRALVVLATVQLERGKQAHAAEALRRYIQVDPDGQHVGEALQILSGMVE